jgi:nicotinamidase-related amidase
MPADPYGIRSPADHCTHHELQGKPMKAVINQTFERLTRASAVFLFIDHQVGPLWEPDAAGLRRDVARLATAAATLGVPTIVSALSCDEWGPIIPELKRAAPDAPIIRRSTVNAWDAPRLRRAVETTGRKHLIMAGVAVEECVVSAAVAAAESGYRVHAVLDASGHFDERAGTAAVARMLRAGVVVTNAGTLLVELVSSRPEPDAAEVLAVVLRHALPSPPAMALTGARFTGDAA